ncbi:MAG TPA: hypothetical protein VF244_09390, partial [Acidimicrobiales bacterium]
SQDPDTSTGRTCTTGANGVCLEDGVVGPVHAFQGLDLGAYCVAETTTPVGYDPAAAQCFTIGVGQAGTTLDLGNLIDPRQHRIIVLVCHEGTDTLHPSDVTLVGDGTETSLGNAGLTPTQEEALCNLGGAQFDHITGHDTQDLEVSLGSPGH